MDLAEALRTTGTCRYFDEQPVDDDTLERIFDAARFAGQGGNRQPTRYIVVRDPDLKRQLRDKYLEPWSEYVAGVEAGRIAIGGDRARRAVHDADRMAHELHRVPALVVVCADLQQITATDAQLDRIGIVAGASVYLSVQNLILAARDEGLGTALTTLLCQFEPWLRTLLSIPAGTAVAGVLALGYPAVAPPRRLSRRPVSELVFLDQYGHHLFQARRDAGSPDREVAP